MTAGRHAALQVVRPHQPTAELWDWTLQPGDRYDAQPDPTGSEGMLLVIAGTLTLESKTGARPSANAANRRRDGAVPRH